MTAHELARLLLAQADCKVLISGRWDGSALGKSGKVLLILRIRIQDKQAAGKMITVLAILITGIVVASVMEQRHRISIKAIVLMEEAMDKGTSPEIKALMRSTYLEE